MQSLDGPHLEIKVFDAFNVRKQLKGLKYLYESAGKYWHKFETVEGFSFDALLGQTRAKYVKRIEVYSETEKLLHKWPASH